MSRFFRRDLFRYFAAGTRPWTGNRHIITIPQKRIFNPTVLHESRTGQPFELLTTVRQFASETDRTAPTKNIWKIIRLLFLITGGLIWTLPGVIYAGYKIGLIKVEVEEDDENENENNQQMNERIFSIFDVSKDADQVIRTKEINEKSSALINIWNQLKLEEGIVSKFGGSVDLIGYKGKSWIEYLGEHHNLGSDILGEQMNGKKKDGLLEWCVACIVAGPQLTGVLELQFCKVNSEWVPVSLRLEGLQKTGDIICDVSGPLPNGVKRFTRLSND